LEAFSTRFAVLAGSQRSCNVIAACIGSGVRFAYDSPDHTARGGADGWVQRDIILGYLAVGLRVDGSGQMTAGNDGYSDGPISSAIRKAEQLRHAGEFPEAYRVLCSVRNGQTDRTGAALMNCIGSALQDLGRLDEAEQHYRRSLRMLKSQFGPDDPDLVFALNNLGGLMLVRGRLSDAARLRERSLELRERSYPAADPVVLPGIENLAYVRLAQKQYAEARRLFEWARKAWEELRPGAPEAAI
jgi:tetratricopeptide (TPR) repeat protein